MSSSSIQRAVDTRTVPATFGCKEVRKDPAWEWDFAASLREKNSREELIAQFARFRGGESALDAIMRRVLLRSLCRAAGHDLQISPELVLKHPETMEFGDNVFIGAHSMIQGR